MSNSISDYDGSVDIRQLIYDTVNSVLDDWIGLTPPRQFTLYDVTMEVRQILGRNISIPHYGPDGSHDMALDLINDKIGDQSLGWNRVLIEPVGLKPGENRPQLYYHLSTNPFDYGHRNTNISVSQLQPDGNPVPDPHVVMSTTLVCAPKDRRLCIPKALMTSQDLKPGDQVVVVADQTNHCLLIQREGLATPNGIKKYTVDLRCTIRVNSSILEQVGLTGNIFTATEDPVLGLIIQ